MFSPMEDFKTFIADRSSVDLARPNRSFKAEKFPSFNNSSIEACSQDRIEKISSAIDSLNPFEEKRDYFATSILAESINLQFDSEGRISLPVSYTHLTLPTKA